VGKKLRESVLFALLATQWLQTGLKDKWSAPLSYEGVRALDEAYHTRDNARRPWLYAVLLFFVLLLALGILRRRRPSLPPDPQEPIQEADPEAAKTTALFERLTKREREVLALICEGHPSKDIAEKLGVSLKTIEYHRSNLLQKTKAGTTAHLVQLATRFGYDLGNTLGK
jgi:two-component system sensor histidine kinase TtrS